MSKFLDRYLAGEHVAVWKELVALGEAIHQKRHYADAAAVAAETMRRARHNVEVLIERLDGQGFRFLTQEANDANQREAGRRVQEIHKQVSAKLTPEDRFDGRCGWHTGSVDPAFGRRSSTGH